MTGTLFLALCALRPCNMTLGQGHNTPLGHEQLGEIFRSKMAVRSYGLVTDFAVCRCDLDLEDMTLGQVMTHPWVIVNNC